MPGPELPAQMDVCYCSDVVSIKQAVENAMAFARATLGPERTAGARLEEVESTILGGKNFWLITLSMLSPDDVPSPIAAAIGVKGKREYKSFTVRKSDGEVMSMKIRELADA
jgi:hypothetical protein